MLLDTNVVSELRKPDHRIDPCVANWAESEDPADHWLSAITVMELAIGISRKERRDPDQGRRLRAWFSASVLDAFKGRILPVDLAAALAAADLHASDPRPERDALIAATAQVHRLTVATRNTRDFDTLGVQTFNPWLHERRTAES
jgi:predicted nucleic acid-binding protein